MSYPEKRIITLEQMTSDIKRRANKLLLNARQLNQNTRFLRSGNGAFCLTRISGTIIGDPSTTTPLAGSTVQVLGHTTGNDYGTVLAADGTYSFAGHLDPTDTRVDLVVTGPGVRFQAKTYADIPISQCTFTGPADLAAEPASGYEYLGGGTVGCQFPVKTSLTLDHSLNGTLALTCSIPGSHGWTGPCWMITYFSGGAPAGTTPTDWVFAGNAPMWIRFDYSFGTGGLVPGPCPNPRSPFLGSLNIPDTLITSKTCPDSGSTLFDCTWTIPGGTNPQFFGPSTQTIRIYET